MIVGRSDDDFESLLDPSERERLMDAVSKLLPTSGLLQFSALADTLNAVPWDVLSACRRLVQSGIAREGNGKERGYFGRI
jgi:hypothetical protein